MLEYPVVLILNTIKKMNNKMLDMENFRWNDSYIILGKTAHGPTPMPALI